MNDIDISRRKVLKIGVMGALILGLPEIPWAEDTKLEGRYDVAVLGAGISGLCAALEAVNNNKTVAVIQIQPFFGGNAMLSTGWFYACNSPVQKRLTDFNDSPELFTEDSLAIAAGKRNPDITSLVARNSGEDIAWLEQHGVIFEDFVSKGMGSTAPRAIQAKGYGKAVIKALGSAIEKTKRATVFYETKATGLITRDNAIVGVRIKNEEGEKNIGCNAVIIATGGYANNPSLIDKYADPKFHGLTGIGDPNQRGDGLEMLLTDGAATANLDLLNVVPTTNKENGIYLTSGALSGGGILVNEKGERFVNELASYTGTAMAMRSQQHVYEILVPQVHSKVQVLVDKEMISKAGSVKELAEKIKVPETNLQKTLDAHNAVTRGEAKDALGRTIYKYELVPPFYYMEVIPHILQTLGGVIVDTKMQVLDESRKPLKQNLYAVGDVTSGYIDGGYRTGDALTYGLVGGRIAGRNA